MSLAAARHWRLRRGRRLTLATFRLLACAARADPLAHAWPSAGHNLDNTRHPSHPGNLGVSSVGMLV